MGKTVKSKSLQLLCATVAMPVLGTAAGTVPVKSHHKLCEHRNRTHAHAWKEMGSLRRQLVFRGHRSPDERGAIRLVISKPWFLWRLRILLSGSFCWAISIPWKQNWILPLLLFFPFLHLSFLMQGNTVMKNISFEGKPQKNFLMFLNYCGSLFCAIHICNHEFVLLSATVRGWRFKTSRMKSLLGWELIWHNLAKTKILWFRYEWLKKSFLLEVLSLLNSSSKTSKAFHCWQFEYHLPKLNHL